MSIAELLIEIANKLAGVRNEINRVFSLIKQKGGIVPYERKLSNLFDAVNSLGQRDMDVNDINFVDFNGVVTTMTIEEAMELTELPQPNEYDNLTFEGWTKTLEEIQDGRCHTIGATYHTTDGAWDVWINIPTDNYILKDIGNSTASSTIDWGDSSPQQTTQGNLLSHTYQKKGLYRLKINTNDTKQPWYDQNKELHSLFVEIHIPQSATVIYTRYMKALEKISIPDNGLNSQMGNWGLTSGGGDKLQDLVLGNSLKGQLNNWRYGSAMLYGLKYLVADGFTGTWDAPTKQVSLRAFSLKNTQAVSNSINYYGYPPNYQFLRQVVFENVTSMGSCFKSGRLLKLVDFGEPISSISNNTFLQSAEHVYIRSLTPPTLGGTTVFWYNFYGLKTTIHIRKDATYTDAEGTTYTGLEAYAHATNWATLYANTNYKFIDDL